MSDCLSDILNPADYVMLITDVNGNQRLVEKTVASLPVELKNQAYETFSFIFDPIADAVEWVVSGIEDVFDAGQQMVEDFVEGVETIIETGLQLIESGFRWIWEEFVMTIIMNLKAQYYDPAKQFVDSIFAENTNYNANASEILSSCKIRK